MRFYRLFLLSQTLKGKVTSFSINVQGSPHLFTLYMRSFTFLDMERKNLFASHVKVSKSVSISKKFID